jgi:hypothetical protein
MCFCWTGLRALLLCVATSGVVVCAQTPQSAPPSSTSSAKRAKAAAPDSGIDAGTVTNGIYRNKTLGFTCKIPDGWVLRTDEMNARSEERDDERREENGEKQNSDSAAATPSSSSARVLLAAFSRPPQAKGEEVNSSILIAAESMAAYPGLKEAAQYFYPLTEVAKAQGFEPDEDPYAVAIGTRTLARGDFHKDVGTRVMRQSTLAMLAHGYAVSITVIAGTDDEVEDLIDGLEFSATGAKSK